MATTSLTAIRTKIRRLTRSPSPAQISDAQIDEYINTFVLYDFPEQLRLFNLKTTFSFYTEPNVDIYDTNTTNPDDPLYDFKNRYITVEPPLYIAGYVSMLSQSREQFFGIYPLVNNIQSIGTAGDGVTVAFSGTLSQVPVLQRSVLFSSVDINGNGLALIDDPQSPTSGNLIVPNAIGGILGTINYVTGAFSFSFPTAPAQGQAINSQTIPYVPSLPQAMLFYDGKFTVRPVPDQPYKITMDAYVRPTELLNANQSPDLQEWWQYIAYGAAKKIFEDRMDLDSVALIMAEFKAQERLILRRTIVQQTTQRTATIYTDQTALGYGQGGWGWGGGGLF